MGWDLKWGGVTSNFVWMVEVMVHLYSICRLWKQRICKTAEPGRFSSVRGCIHECCSWICHEMHTAVIHTVLDNSVQFQIVGGQEENDGVQIWFVQFCVVSIEFRLWGWETRPNSLDWHTSVPCKQTTKLLAESCFGSAPVHSNKHMKPQRPPMSVLGCGTVAEDFSTPQLLRLKQAEWGSATSSDCAWPVVNNSRDIKMRHRRLVDCRKSVCLQQKKTRYLRAYAARQMSAFTAHFKRCLSFPPLSLQTLRTLVSGVPAALSTYASGHIDKCSTTDECIQPLFSL